LLCLLWLAVGRYKHIKCGNVLLEHRDKVFEAHAGHRGVFYVGEDLANTTSPIHEVLTKVCQA
jgi:hypothetical protein